MISNSEAISHVFSAVSPGVQGAIQDYITGAMAIIGIMLILLAFYYVKDFLNISYAENGDFSLSLRSRSDIVFESEYSEFEADEREYYELDAYERNNQGSFRGKVAAARKKRFISKWSDRNVIKRSGFKS